MEDKVYIIFGCIASLAIVFFILYRIKKILDGINSIIRDTLKRYDKNEKRLKWSSVRLVGFQCFNTALGLAVYDAIKTGFNIWVFMALLTVAITGKLPDAWSKKINPDGDTSTTIPKD